MKKKKKMSGLLDFVSSRPVRGSGVQLHYERTVKKIVQKAEEQAGAEADAKAGVVKAADAEVPTT